MRRLALALALPLAACGDDSNTSNTATDSGTGTPSTTGAGPDPTVTGGPDPSASTGDGGSASMTASGTNTSSPTTGQTTTDATVSGTSTGDDTASTTTPVVSDTDVSTSTASTTSDDTTGVAETGSTSTDSNSGDDTTGAPVEPCACPDLEVPLDDGIFVLSITAELWKFFPADYSFTKLGDLTCNTPPPTFSMAVDRQGYAWVQYQTGDLRTVDVTNVGNCTDPGYQEFQMGITNFGMAFVSNSQFDACDRIYGVRATGIPEGNAISDLFSIDPDTLNVLQIGKSDYGTAEVTGTGDGRLFLFAGANPAKLVEVNKNNGQKLGVTPLPGVELGSAWAFAFFGGDFFFFTNSQGGPGSEVTHIDYDDDDMNGQKEITVVVPDAPISIVGAGVSTCAPTAPQ